MDPAPPNPPHCAHHLLLTVALSSPRAQPSARTELHARGFVPLRGRLKEPKVLRTRIQTQTTDWNPIFNKLNKDGTVAPGDGTRLQGGATAAWAADCKSQLETILDEEEMRGTGDRKMRINDLFALLALALAPALPDWMAPPVARGWPPKTAGCNQPYHADSRAPESMREWDPADVPIAVIGCVQKDTRIKMKPFGSTEFETVLLQPGDLLVFRCACRPRLGSPTSFSPEPAAPTATSPPYLSVLFYPVAQQGRHRSRRRWLHRDQHPHPRIHRPTEVQTGSEHHIPVHGATGRVGRIITFRAPYCFF